MLPGRTYYFRLDMNERLMDQQQWRGRRADGYLVSSAISAAADDAACSTSPAGRSGCPDGDGISLAQ